MLLEEPVDASTQPLMIAKTSMQMSIHVIDRKVSLHGKKIVLSALNVKIIL